MKKFFQLFLFLPRFLAILAAYLLRGKKTLTCMWDTHKSQSIKELILLWNYDIPQILLPRLPKAKQGKKHG